MTDDSDKQVFSWQAHPAREQVRRAVLGGAVILLMGVLAGVLGGSAWWGLAAATVLVLALNRFYFPSKFALDDDGITARYLLGRRRCMWRELRRFLHDQYGGYLSRRAVASRLDAYQGLHIYFGNQRDEVVRRIRQYMRQGD